MVSLAMMTLVEHNKWKVCQFDKPSSQAVQEHLWNDDDYCWFFKFSHKLFLWHQTALNFLFLCLSNIFILFTMNAYNLSTDPVPTPIQVNLISCMFFVQFLAEWLVLNNSMKGSLDGFSLLFDKLDGIGKEHNFLFLCIGKVVIHGCYCNSCFSKTSWQVDDRVAILTFLEESLLIISEVDLDFGSIDVFKDRRLRFVLILIIINVFIFIFILYNFSHLFVFLHLLLRLLILVINDFILIVENAFIIRLFLRWLSLLQVVYHTVIIRINWFVL